MTTAEVYTSAEDYIQKRYNALGKTSDGLLLNRYTFQNRLSKEKIPPSVNCKNLSKMIAKLWPSLHPKLDSTATQHLFIKSLYAEYYYKGQTKKYTGMNDIKSIVGTHLETLGASKEMKAQMFHRLTELEPYLISGVIMQNGFQFPVNTAEESRTSTSPTAQRSSTVVPETIPANPVVSFEPVPLAQRTPAAAVTNVPPLPAATTPFMSGTPNIESIFSSSRTSESDWESHSTAPTDTNHSLPRYITRNVAIKLGIHNDSTTDTASFESSKGRDKDVIVKWDWDLLQTLVEEEDDESVATGDGIHYSACSRAICFSPAVLDKVASIDPISQFAVLGTRVPTIAGPNSKENNLVMLNSNHPTSFFICGLQGQGKSHTLSCLLENFLIPSPILGQLQKSLSALVLHYDSYSSRQAFRPSEAVFLSNPSPVIKDMSARVSSVTVLVSESNYHAMKQAYEVIPNVFVRPLKLNPKDLTTSTILTLMAVNTADKTPLYMTQVLQLLRELAIEYPEFDYRAFRDRISKMKLERLQRTMLDQRLGLLDSFLDLTTDPAEQAPLITDAPGTLTVIDLSCPFVGEDTACIFFNICIELYLASDTGATGKVIAVDEAHKYMTNSPAAQKLTDQLLGIVRLQRHYGARVIIATQEPTIDPLLIDLCSVKIVHRFTSPDWFEYLGKHLPGVKEGSEDIFAKICRLRRGEAVVFDPSAVLIGEGSGRAPNLMDDMGDCAGKSGESEAQLEAMVDQCWRIKIRNRLTMDGGKSIVAV